MMDWSTIVIRAARPSGELRVLETTFSASNFGFKIGLLLKASKSNFRLPKPSENLIQKPPKTPPKTTAAKELARKTQKREIALPLDVFP